jgi:hypothetical protein
VILRRLPTPSTTNVRCGWKRCTRHAGQIKRCTLHRNGPLARARHRGRWQRPPGLDTVCSSLSSIARISDSCWAILSSTYKL